MLQLLQHPLRQPRFGDGGPTSIVSVDGDTDAVLGDDDGACFVVDLSACAEEGWGYDGIGGEAFGGCCGEDQGSSGREAVFPYAQAEFCWEGEEAGMIARVAGCHCPEAACWKLQRPEAFPVPSGVVCLLPDVRFPRRR